MKRSMLILATLLIGLLALGSSGFALPADGVGPPPGTAVDDPRAEVQGVAPKFDQGIVRLGGANRYDTAVEISKRHNPGVPAVYVATGADYPDALAAAAAASHIGVPVLLTASTAVPANVLAELGRLRPAKIYVVGGTAAISAGVEKRLGTIAPTHRLSGPTRYATSRAIVSEGFRHVTSAFIVTGRNFADALSSTGAAGYHGAPVIIVDGAATQIDDATLEVLHALGITSVAVIGGLGAITKSIEQQISDAGFTTTRVGGQDRFDTAALLNRQYFPYGSHIIAVATGQDFPDALAAGALAGFMQIPLYVTQTTCVPKPVHQAIVTVSPTTTLAVGGPAVLQDGATRNVQCP